MLTDLPGIRVHTDIESMMWALEEFFLSMLGVNIAVGARTAWPGAFPHRLLVIDEFGTFAGMAARMHRRTGGAGPAPALDQRRQIEWQGRQAGHRLVLAVHQLNVRLFGDSDSRGQYGYRLITGAYTTSLRRLTFGFAPRIEWDARIKGRGVVGVGEAENLIHAAQLAWMPAAERRRYALTGPPPPDWFTQMRPAPWIDAHVISEGRKLAGVSLVDVPAVGVPPGQDIRVPAQTRRQSRPMSRPRTPEPVPWPSPARPARPGGRYLGYRKPDSFRRARTRRPIPGETKTGDGRPS
ncbi:MAG: hypothetical protein M3Z75_31740 [Actinomycetota bacterium]|nr:hypothetical protein [Actinomycetota bacterium]